MKKFQWINLFVRDILLVLIIAYLDWKLNYNTWIYPFLMGEMMVLISWHFSDFYNETKTISCQS